MTVGLPRASQRSLEHRPPDTFRVHCAVTIFSEETSYAENLSLTHLEAFAYYIQQSSNSPEVANWLATNSEKVEAFLTWSKNYVWYKGK
jgi:hypothetical protein